MNRNHVKSVFKPLIICAFSLVVSQCAGEKNEVVLKYQEIESETLKPPQRAYALDLMIQNSANEAAWYLWTDSSAGIPKNGIFQADADWDPASLTVKAIQCDKLGGLGTLVIVHFIGRSEESSFYAMHLLAGGFVQIRNYPLISFGKRESIDVLKGDLLVDGEVALENWFQEDVSNSKRVEITVPPHGLIDSSIFAELPKLRKADPEGLQRIQFEKLKSYTFRLSD